MDQMQMRRRATMAVLAESAVAEIASLVEGLEPLPAYGDMRAPENGRSVARG